ncbi:MAG TPA: prepilin-type N-terminal cleavage/methylation domain-containing protein [Longimicrobiales bacterium]|nr:prepilin-type N-terminal cleavage/methylation domain-containing protein [Longimicrobiales bacterium]
MKTSLPCTARRGFTLVEVVVTLIILAILVAAILPTVASQVDDAEPTRAANDVTSIATGIRLFHLNIRPQYPQDLEDLVNVITTTGDQNVDGVAYATKDSTNWKGPYIEASIPTTGGTVSTAYNALIGDTLRLFESAANLPSNNVGFTAANADFLAIQVDSLSLAEFTNINKVIDGANEATPQASGRVRRAETAAGDTSVFYLALPYRQ